MSVNRDPVSSGVVSQCEANDCTYNQDGQCNAGAIYFNFVEGKANCYTYTTDSSQEISGVQNAGQVAQCSVVDCSYNEVQACVSDSISVSFSDGIAKCNQYVVSDNEK